MCDYFCDCCKRPCAECRVLLEFQGLTQPGGKAAAKAAYLAECEARALAKSQGEATDTLDRLRKAGFPVQAVGALREPRPTPALEEAKRFCGDRFALFFLLLGERGLGKTVAAAYVAQDVARRFDWHSQPSGSGGPPEPIRCVTASSITRLSAFEREDKAEVGRLERCLLLVVDDCGDEGTDFGRGVLVDLLMARHGRGRRSVLTSNLTGEAFKKRYGAALADRIRSSGYVWEGKGESLRGRHGRAA